MADRKVRPAPLTLSEEADPRARLFASTLIAMRAVSIALLLAAASTAAAAQTTTPQPPPSGALEPQQTSPLPGATPVTPTAPPAPAPAVPAPGQAVVSPPPLGRVFAAEQGLIFNAIRPDKVMDFETVIAKLRAALANSKDPVRNQQGWGWKMFKATEPGPNGSVLYVFVMDPAVKGADYGVAKILSEAYPAEIMELYRMYTGAFATAGQTLINLQPVPAPGTAAPAAGTTSSPAAPASVGAPVTGGAAPPPSVTPKR